MRFFCIMRPFARTTTTIKDFEIVPITPPFSFFDFVDTRFYHLPSLRRLLSQVRQHGGKTMVIEEIDTAHDLDEENDDIRKRHPDLVWSKSFRLGFFKKSFSTKRGLSSAENNQFIGYAIVKTDEFLSRARVSRIFESVIGSSRHPNNFVRGVQTWTCRIMGNEFAVDGYLYAQQNNITNVCAHVAIRAVAARYHKNGDMSYREMNDIVGINHIDRKTGGVDGEGLSSAEMVKILEAAGARCFVADYVTVKNAPAPFQKYLYGSIESGFPAIIIFGTTLSADNFHAIPVFGHTFNEDTWVPSAEFSYFRVGAGTRYIPSESWLSMFIGHDDNFGSNFCIPRGYLNTKRICDKLNNEPETCPMEMGGVAYAIGTVPKEVKVSPIRAEVIGVDYLFTILPQAPVNESSWTKRLESYSKNDMLVLRPIIANGRDYINYLKKVRDWDNNRIRPVMISVLKNYLKERLYWLIELSVPELFSANRRKVGEVLIRSDIKPSAKRDLNHFVMARLPGHFVLYERGGPSKPRYRFIPAGIKNHVPLFGT